MANSNNNSRDYTPLPSMSKPQDKTKSAQNSIAFNSGEYNPLLDLLNGSFSSNQENVVDITNTSPSKVEDNSDKAKKEKSPKAKPLQNKDSNVAQDVASHSKPSLNSGSVFSYIDPFELIPEDVVKTMASNNFENDNTKARNDLLNPTLDPGSRGYHLPKQTIYFGKEKLENSVLLSKKITENHSIKISHNPEALLKKSVAAQQGFSVYSGLEGNITAVKETTNQKIFLKEHKQGILDMAFWKPANQDLESEDRYLATISLDSSLLLWRFKNVCNSSAPISYSLEFGLRGTPHKESSHSYLLVDINPANMDIIAVATDLNEVLLFDLCLYMNPSGTIFANEKDIASITNSIKINHVISYISFSSDGGYLAIGDINGNTKLAALTDTTITSLKTFAIEAGSSVSYLQFSGINNELLIIGLNNNSKIQLWDISKQQIIQNLNFSLDNSAKIHLCYDRDSSLLFVGNNSRNTLLTFHITTHFSFLLEHVLPDKLIDIEITQDIATYKEPLRKKNIRLYLNSLSSGKMYTVSLNSFLPGEATQSLTLPDSYFSDNDITNHGDVSLLDDLFKSASNKPTNQTTRTRNQKPDYSDNFSSTDREIPNHWPPHNSNQQKGVPFDYDNISLESLFNSSETVSKKNQNNQPFSSFNASQNTNDEQVSKSVNSKLFIPSSVISASNPKTSPTSKSLPSSGKAQGSHQNTKNGSNIDQSGLLPESILNTIEYHIDSNSQKMTNDINKLDSQLKSLNKSTAQIPQLLAQSCTPNLMSSVQEVVTSELPQIISKEFSSTFKHFISSKDFETISSQHIKIHVQDALQSPSLIKTISNVVDGKIGNHVRSALDQQTEALVLAYQNAATTMFQQISTTFEDGLSKFQNEQKAILDAQNNELLRLKNLINAQHNQNGNHKSQIDKASNVSSKGDQRDIGAPKSSSSQKSNTRSDLNAQQNEIDFDSQNVEQELNQAISTNDTHKITLLFSDTHPKTVLKHCEISQKNLLVLAKLMAKGLGVNTYMKLAAIEECVMKINPSDPDICEHVSRFMANVKSNIKSLPMSMFSQDQVQNVTEILSNIVNTCTALQEQAQKACQ